VNLNALGNVYLKDGRLKEAETMLNEALEIDEETEDVHDKVVNLNVLANVFLCEHRFDKAQEIFRSLLKIYKSFRMNENIKRIKNYLYITELLRKTSNSELYKKLIEEVKEECNRISNEIIELNQDMSRGFWRLESKIDGVKEYIRNNHMDLVTEIQDLDEQQLKNFENLIQRELEQIQDKNLRNEMKSKWEKAKEAISISADFLTFISSTITIFNAAKGQSEIASSIIIIRDFINHIKIKKFV
jgi:tetratricopeptide (TPR) repeat protein